MYKIGIVGATGYTGSELVRLLHSHREAEIAFITSESYAGQKFSDVHPQFTGIHDTTLISANDADLGQVDAVFLALPHGVSMDFVKRWSGEDVKIIDLSGDFRLDGVATYEKWYNKDHNFPEGFKEAVFGMPELFREAIKPARLVANPGCFPTGATLSVYPLVKEGWVAPRQIIMDSKTGVTGAGVKPKDVAHFPNLNDNFKAYSLKSHRHTVEIEQTLSKNSAEEVRIQFTPHLLPVDRGIFTTAYCRPVKEITEAALHDLYQQYYKDEPFIRLRKDVPEIKQIRGTNFVDIHTTYDARTGNLICLSAIDNLVKGAAGQAIQNMNLMLGINEGEGLDQIPLKP